MVEQNHLQKTTHTLSDAQAAKAWLWLFLAWCVACVATAGSLFFSEIMQFPPCALCWYQRICMYPLTVVLVAGLFPVDRSVLKYSLPLAVLGWLMAAYHNLLHWQVIPQAAAPCRQGVSCATVYINLFGFVTIPLLSLVAFTLILIALNQARRRTNVP